MRAKANENVGGVLQEAASCQLSEGADDQATGVTGGRDHSAATSSAGPEVDYDDTPLTTVYNMYDM